MIVFDIPLFFEAELPPVVVMLVKVDQCCFHVPGVPGLYDYAWLFKRKCLERQDKFKDLSWLWDLHFKNVSFLVVSVKRVLYLGLPQYKILIWSLKTSINTIYIWLFVLLIVGHKITEECIWVIIPMNMDFKRFMLSILITRTKI